MCLAVPMEIIAIKNEYTAQVMRGTCPMDINIAMVENPQIGDFVIVHAGFAISRLDTKEAEERLKLFEEVKDVIHGDI